MCEGKPVFDLTIEMNDNAMLKHRPDLFNEWDFEKNDALGLDIYKVTKGSAKKAWWICQKCGSDYERAIDKTVQAWQCSYCRGYKVNHTNSLATKNPQLAKEWHPSKNGELTANDVTCGRGIKVWWMGECGHEWEAVILKRAGRGDGCPYCSHNPKVLKGFNDMWTTNPNLASQLADAEEGYKYTQGSSAMVKWKCLECGTITSRLRISAINSEGVSCPACSDGVSYGEKFLYGVLESGKIEFDYEKEFVKWGKGKRYDFYLPRYNWIVEVHGEQHYGDNGFKSYGGRTLKEEQENDRLKESLAKENGIDEYIVIDARLSSLEFLLDSIENSKLNQIISMENIDGQEIEKRALKSLVVITCQLWCEGMTIIAIAQKFKRSRTTIRKYLKKGRSAGICDYDEQESSVKHGRRKIVQLSPEGEYIKTWISGADAAKFYGVARTSISRCARGGRPNSAGFKWVYEEDYMKEVI